jgi:hypothetical protein
MTLTTDVFPVSATSDRVSYISLRDVLSDGGTTTIKADELRVILSGFHKALESDGEIMTPEQLKVENRMREKFTRNKTIFNSDVQVGKIASCNIVSLVSRHQNLCLFFLLLIFGLELPACKLLELGIQVQIFRAQEINGCGTDRRTSGGTCGAGGDNFGREAK